jgi:hypothetical protein
MKKRKPAVSWYLPKKKNPIAYCHTADSEFISLINQPNKTPNELMQLFTKGTYLPSEDVITVLQAYIDKGHGDIILVTHPI